MQMDSGVKRLRTGDDDESPGVQSSEKPPRERGLVSFKSQIPNGTTYIRTRHNNLRCFPYCAPVHKQNAFCGSPIYVNVKKNEWSQGANSSKVYGAFHKANTHEHRWTLDRQFRTEDETTEIGSAILQARMYREEDDTLCFIFMPDGKWTYAATLIETDVHYFTIFYVVDGNLRDLKPSEPFHVIPTWKVPHGGSSVTPAATVPRVRSASSSAGDKVATDASNESPHDMESDPDSSENTPGIPLRVLNDRAMLPPSLRTSKSTSSMEDVIRDRYRQALAMMSSSSVSSASSSSGDSRNGGFPLPSDRALPRRDSTESPRPASLVSSDPRPSMFSTATPTTASTLTGSSTGMMPQATQTVFVRRPLPPAMPPQQSHQQQQAGVSRGLMVGPNPGSGLVLSSDNAGLLNPSMYSMNQRPTMMMSPAMTMVNTPSGWTPALSNTSQPASSTAYHPNQQVPNVGFSGPLSTNSSVGISFAPHPTPSSSAAMLPPAMPFGMSSGLMQPGLSMSNPLGARFTSSQRFAPRPTPSGYGLSASSAMGSGPFTLQVPWPHMQSSPHLQHQQNQQQQQYQQQHQQQQPNGGSNGSPPQ